MPRRSRVIRILTVASMVAAMSVGMGVGAGASAAPESGDRARTCTVPSGLKGEPVQVARQMIRKAGCLGVIIVRNRCASQEEFGLVVVGPRPSGEIPFKHSITLWRGIVGTMCDELPDTSTGATAYDGAYAVTILIQGGPAAGHTVVDLSFTVTDGRMSGDFTGTVDANGVSTDATGVIAGGACRLTGAMQFVDGRATGPMTCSGDLGFNGVLTAIRR